MDNRQTNDMESNVNNNPGINQPEEDLTSIFNTPVDENTNNLGVGETSSNYSSEISEDTEILDLNEINAFKEAEIKVEPLEINVDAEPVAESIVEPVEDNPFEMNTESMDTLLTDNNLEVSNVENNSTAEEPVTVVGETPIIDQVEQVNTINTQPNIMSGINNLNPVELEAVSADDVNENSAVNDQDETLEINSTVVPPVLNTEVNNDNEEQPKDKKKNKFVLPLIIVLVVIAGVVGLYFLLFNNPKNVFDKTVSSGFDYLYNGLDNATKYDVISGTSSLSYELTSPDQSMQSVFDMFNGIVINYDYAVDYKNKLMNFDFKSTYNNEKLLDFNLYGENSKGYIFLKDVYDKYLSTPIEGYEEIFNTTKNIDEVKTILSSVEKALNNALTNDDFVKGEETIKIDGKDVKVNKDSLVLTNSNVNRITKSILKTLKDDADFISAVNKLSADESVDTKAAIEDALANMGDVDSEDKSVITFSIYTKGLLKEFVGFNFDVKDEEVMSISIVKSNENTYDIVAKQDNKELFTGSIKLDVTKNSDSESLNGEVLINIPEMLNIKLNMKSTTNYNATFTKPNVTNSVDANMLTDVETNTIMTNLMSSPGLTKLITNIQTLTGAMTNNVPTTEPTVNYNALDSTYNNYGV